MASSDAKRLETDDTHLYFVNGTAIERVSFAGGTTETLATATFDPTDLAVDSAHVYWTSKLGGVVQRVAKTGGPVELISSATSPGDIAEFGPTVYWSELDTSGAVVVMQAAKSGGLATKLADADMLYDLEADADGVYVTQYGYATIIRFFPAVGGPEGSLPCPAFPHCEDVEPAGDMIYSFARAELAMGGWAIREAVKSPTSHHAFAANLNMFEALSKLRADTKNDFVYFSTSISAGAEWTSVIRKAPKCSTGMSTDVVEPTNGPVVRDFAMGPQNLYFSLSNGEIYSSPK